MDVWAVAGIDEQRLVTTGSGFRYFPARIPRGQISLADCPSDEPPPQAHSRQQKNKQGKKKTPRAGK